MRTILIYAIATIISTFFIFLATKDIKNNKIYKIPLVVSFVVLFLLIVLRGIDVGTDYRIYISAYDRIVNDYATTQDYNWLGASFVVLCQIIGFIAQDKFIIFIAIIAFLTMFCIYKAIIQNSKVPWLSIFLLIATNLFYQTFNQFRQMLAIAVVLYSIKFIKEKQLFKYILTIVGASLAHSTALIMIPIYFIANIKINLKVMSAYLVVLIILFTNYNLIETLLLNTSYSGYIDSYLDIEFAGKAVMNTFVRIAMLFMVLIFYKKVIEKNPKDNCLYHMVIICTIFQIITLKTSLFGRVTTYFFIFYILLIPQIVSAVFNKPKTRLAVIVAIVLAFTCYHFVYFNSEAAINSGYTDYYFLFEEV